MKNGLLSIVMVSYNHGPYLEEAIQSVISQTYKNWELIIIDDGSSDNSREIAGEYAAKLPGQIKLSVHKGKENLGICASYALGLSLCWGEFIGFLEPDDVWADANNAELKIDSLRYTDAGLVYSDFEPIGEPGIINRRMRWMKFFPPIPSGIPFDALPYLSIGNFIMNFSGVILKKKAVENFRFNLTKESAVCLDWFLWLQVSMKHKFLFIPRKLIKWRLCGQSYWSKDFLNKNDVSIIKFEIKLRIAFLRKLILQQGFDIFKIIKTPYFLIAGFVKRAIMYVRNKDTQNA